MMLKILLGAALFAVAWVLPLVKASAGTLSVLTAFNGGDGASPYGTLIADSAGNLYGTTLNGGANNSGTVFELTPPAAGQAAWTETVLFSFSNSTGTSPGGSLTADSAGNLYGTTQAGGAYDGGTVFKLAPPAQGQTAWTPTVLCTFNAGDDTGPPGGLIFDRAGNLYGTTRYDGAYSRGTVFELTPPAAGQTAWTETVLFSFNGANGANSFASLIFDGAGNLYGTTLNGGGLYSGNVFELTPPAAAQTAWTETVLFSFNGTNGNGPFGSLIFDSVGNLYGTTWGGGASHEGNVFELMPPAAGQTAWTETVLASFKGKKGEYPQGSLIADSAGNLYGTTNEGGADKHNGTVFELTKPVGHKTVWKETVLASFDVTDGAGPNGSLIFDGAGNLYGTTIGGGQSGDGRPGNGTVFELTP